MEKKVKNISLVEATKEVKDISKNLAEKVTKLKDTKNELMNPALRSKASKFYVEQLKSILKERKRLKELVEIHPSLFSVVGMSWDTYILPALPSYFGEDNLDITPIQLDDLLSAFIPFTVIESNPVNYLLQILTVTYMQLQQTGGMLYNPNIAYPYAGIEVTNIENNQVVKYITAKPLVAGVPLTDGSSWLNVTGKYVITIPTNDIKPIFDLRPELFATNPKDGYYIFVFEDPLKKPIIKNYPPNTLFKGYFDNPDNTNVFSPLAYVIIQIKGQSVPDAKIITWEEQTYGSAPVYTWKSAYLNETGDTPDPMEWSGTNDIRKNIVQVDNMIAGTTYNYTATPISSLGWVNIILDYNDRWTRVNSYQKVPLSNFTQASQYIIVSSGLAASPGDNNSCIKLKMGSNSMSFDGVAEFSGVFVSIWQSEI